MPVMTSGGVAIPLPTGWLNLKGVSFIRHRIIKDNVAVFREDEVMAYILPDLYPVRFNVPYPSSD